MQVRRRFAMTVLALSLLTGIAGCGEMQEARQGLQEARQGLQEAQQGVEQAQRKLGAAQACARATGLAQFTPDFADPQQARAEARAKAEEIGKLARRTTNQTLKQNLLDLQSSLEQVASGEITVRNSAQWARTKLDRTRKVLAVCGRLVE